MRDLKGSVKLFACLAGCGITLCLRQNQYSTNFTLVMFDKERDSYYFTTQNQLDKPIHPLLPWRSAMLLTLSCPCEVHMIGIGNQETFFNQGGALLCSSVVL